MSDDAAGDAGARTDAGSDRVVVLDEIVVGDEPDSWRSAGFVVNDDGSCQVGSVRIRLVGRVGGKRIRSWSFRGLDPAALDREGTIDGLPTTVSDGHAISDRSAARHPNGVESIDHVVVVTPDRVRTVAAFERVDLAPRRTRTTDTYGAPFVQTFFRAGEVILELIAPEETGEGPTGFFGLAFTVTDLDATAAHLGDGMGHSKDAVQPGRRIATLRHKNFGISVATAFMSPETH